MILKTNLFTLFLFVFWGMTSAQKQLKLIDEITQIPIVGADIFCDKTLLGRTNADGIIRYETNCTTIIARKKNYEDEMILVKELQTISMAKTDRLNTIETVVIENKSDPKAISILEKVYRKFDQNSPKSLPSYSYKAYNKISLDIDEDSLSDYQKSISQMLKKDSISNAKTAKKDSASDVFKVFQNSKMFLWERALEYLYSKKLGEKIIVLDNRISGLQEPIYEMMALRSNRDKMPKEIDIANRKNYRFFLSDTITVEGRETFVIKFRELKKNSNSFGNRFSGFLFVDSETYGLKKIERNAKIPSDGNVNSNYIYFGGKWFLESENMKMKMGNISFNENVNKEKPEKEDTNKKKEKYNNYGFFYTRYFDHKTPIEESPKDFKGYTYSVQNSDGKLLDQYRTVPLSEREKTTYTSIDSLGQKYKIESKARYFLTLAHGKTRLGIFDSDLAKSIGYNKYEGFKSGFALKTNETFHTRISPDFYISYGFRDKAFKYGIGLDWKISAQKVSFFRLAYYDDVMVAGRYNENFWDFRMKLNNAGIALNNDRFFRFQGARFSFENDFGNSISTRFTIKKQRENALFDYNFAGLGNQFDLSSLQFSLHYAPFSKHIMTPRGKLTTEKKYPDFYLNIEKGISAFGGDFTFTKVDFLANFNFKNRLGNTGIRLYAGLLDGDAPIWHHFSANGLSANGTVNFNLTSYLGFATMNAGQYYNDRFIANYITHRIPWYFKINKNSISSFDLIHRSIIGQMNKPELHQFQYKTIDHLYQEVGLEWNNFFSRWFNLGMFYRVGHYQTPEFWDNFGFQVKFKLLGF